MVSEGASVYSPDRRRKKNAMMIISAVACRSFALAGRCCVMYAICSMTDMGVGLTWLSEGSSFFQAAILCLMQKSFFKSDFRRGSLVLSASNICATSRR